MGDNNTKWFHKKASLRRACNTIRGIHRDNGGWTEDLEDVESTFIQYFQSIFTSSNPSSSDLEAVLNLLPPKITHEMNSCLLAPFGLEEIEAAVRQMFPVTWRGWLSYSFLPELLVYCGAKNCGSLSKHS